MLGRPSAHQHLIQTIIYLCFVSMSGKVARARKINTNLKNEELQGGIYIIIGYQNVSCNKEMWLAA